MKRLTSRGPFYVMLIGLLIINISCNKKNPDRFVKIDDKRQHILDLGQGEPIVIFLHGRGDNLKTFDSIQHIIAKITRTFSYDRAGLGKSEFLDSVRTFENMTKELDKILDTEKINPPYILVGHSLGCMLARYFYHLHKDKIGGIILIDPGHEDQLQEMHKYKSENELRYLDSLIRVVDPTWPKGFRDEIKYSEYNDGLMKKIIPPTNIPVTVITSSFWNEQFEKDYLMTKKDMDVKVELVDNWVKTLPKGKHILTDRSQHWIHVSEPELVSKEIKNLVDYVRLN